MSCPTFIPEAFFYRAFLFTGGAIIGRSVALPFARPTLLFALSNNHYRRREMRRGKEGGARLALSRSGTRVQRCNCRTVLGESNFQLLSCHLHSDRPKGLLADRPAGILADSYQALWYLFRSITRFYGCYAESAWIEHKQEAPIMQCSPKNFRLAPGEGALSCHATGTCTSTCLIK